MKRAMFCLVAALSLTGLASASLVEQNGSLVFGTGLGNVPTILTVQATGSGTTESGCVAFIGGTTVAGANACPGFVQAGQMVGGSNNQAQLVSNAELASGFSGPISGYGNLALVVNPNQTGAATPLTLTGLSMIVTNPATNAVFRSSGVSGPDCSGDTCILTPPTSGVGSSGVFVFTLNADQQAKAQQMLGPLSTAFRVGAFVSASNAVGGPETIYLGAVPAAAAPAPEPSTYALLGLGLLAFGLARKRVIN